MVVSRFAPTTSGRAHPGTLLAALLAWLDCRSWSGRFLLRLEDIDPSCLSQDYREGLVEDLRWFGLDWDQLIYQSSCRSAHEEVLETFASLGLLYECTCSRSDVRLAGIPSAAGGWVYPGTCRRHRVRDWRKSRENLRCDLSDLYLELKDESGMDLSQDVAAVMGDPLVRRADGSVTYQLAVVADDLASGVNRVVRGRDIASSTATQAAFYRLLGRPVPVYRHHLLLLEGRGDKLAKFHKSVGADVLRNHYSAEALRGFLAGLCGLQTGSEPVSMGDLLRNFDWKRIKTDDQPVYWDGQRLSTPGLT